MPHLTAIIITKNEAANIADCLDMLKFCDERIVVDSGSSDSTVKLAEGKGARVVLHDWEGFGAQKNYALSLARGEWVLTIDADERVTPELAQEITTAIQDACADGFEIIRRSMFCGREMGRSGLFPDRVLRLFRRGKARFSDDVVHERVLCDGDVRRLSAPLMHYPVLRLEEAIRRMDIYSTLGAEKILATGRRVYFFTGIAHAWFAFLRIYILQLGFLDGTAGFLLAIANAEGTYYRYMKAWLARQRRE